MLPDVTPEVYNESKAQMCRVPTVYDPHFPVVCVDLVTMSGSVHVLIILDQGQVNYATRL